MEQVAHPAAAGGLRLEAKAPPISVSSRPSRAARSRGQRTPARRARRARWLPQRPPRRGSSCATSRRQVRISSTVSEWSAPNTSAPTTCCRLEAGGTLRIVRPGHVRLPDDGRRQLRLVDGVGHRQDHDLQERRILTHCHLPQAQQFQQRQEGDNDLAARRRGVEEPGEGDGALAARQSGIASILSVTVQRIGSRCPSGSSGARCSTSWNAVSRSNSPTSPSNCAPSAGS